MKILITGGSGKLGRSLLDTQPGAADVIALDSSTLDLRDDVSIATALAAQRPDVIVNTAAYTAVDQAESEAGLAERINGAAVAQLAAYARSHACRLVQISTDYVFSGPRTEPWLPDDTPQPISVYGRSKLAGETAALSLGAQARVLRTSWVYSEHGECFVKTMLRLGADRDELTVVDDQTGSPTYARNLARAVWRLIEHWPAPAILHYADSGSVTWRGFAEEIFGQAARAGLLPRAPRVLPTTTAAYGAPAPRPPYTVLATDTSAAALNFNPPPWQTALADMLSRLAAVNET